ncbi:MAG TPA: hypothetical protein VK823_13890 [Streptosporangiaceae bacterium]|nr:hypothetical protein [Streptosporangiaceae bacterium]
MAESGSDGTLTSAVSLPEAPGADAAEGRAWPRVPASALILACYLVAAVVLTWHLWQAPGSATVVGNPNDTDQYAWFMRYAALAVVHFHLPSLITTSMNAPAGINMMWNTSVLLPGILLTPVTILAGPQVSLTVMLTIGFAGSAASLFYVLRRWGASDLGAAVGGAVYGFSPALTHAAIGHYSLQFAVLPPLMIDAGLRLLTGRGRPVPTGLGLGLLIVIQVFFGEEVLVDTVFAAVLIGLVLAISRPREVRRHVVGAATGVAVALGVTLAGTGWALWYQFFGPLTEHGSPFWPDQYKNDVLGFFMPSGFQILHTGSTVASASQYQGGTPEYVAYLGISLIAVLIVTTVFFWKHLVVRVLAVTFFALEILSLGADLLINGPIQIGQPQHGLPLPWRFVADLPVLGIALPDRLSVVADGAAAALLAFGIDLARRRLGPGRSGATLIATLAAVAILPLVPFPLPATPAVPLPAGWTEVLGALRLAPDARVLVVPVPTPTTTEALRWQAEGGQRISLIGGYFEGPTGAGQAHIDGPGLPPLVYDLNALWYGLVPPSWPDATQIRATLDYWKPAAVVADGSTSPLLRGYLEVLFGPPTLRYGSMLAWQLRK